jgi:hypothetical protein
MLYMPTSLKTTDALKRGYQAAAERFERCGRDLDAFAADLLPGVPRPLEGEQLEAWLSAFDGVPPEGHPDRDDFVRGLGMGGFDIFDRECPDGFEIIDRDCPDR